MTGIGRLSPRRSTQANTPANASPAKPASQRAAFDEARTRLMTMPGRPVWVQSARVVRLPRSSVWGGRNAPPTFELRVTVDTGKRAEFSKVRTKLKLDDMRVRVDEQRAPRREKTTVDALDKKGEPVTRELRGQSFPPNRFR